MPKKAKIPVPVMSISEKTAFLKSVLKPLGYTASEVWSHGRFDNWRINMGNFVFDFFGDLAEIRSADLTSISTDKVDSPVLLELKARIQEKFQIKVTIVKEQEDNCT